MINILQQVFFFLNSIYIIYVKQRIFNVQISIISNNIYFLLENKLLYPFLNIYIYIFIEYLYYLCETRHIQCTIIYSIKYYIYLV
jgi:hypothetical protein